MELKMGKFCQIITKLRPKLSFAQYLLNKRMDFDKI